MNIVLIGHVCIDHNTTENATYTSWGSSVLYMAHYLQGKHHITPTVVSTYGPDMMSYLSNIRILPSQPDQSETLVYENDTRVIPRIWKAHKIENAVAPALTSEIVHTLQEADILIVAPLLPNYPAAYLQELISHTNSTALKMLCPQGYFRDIGKDGLVKWREFAEAADVIPLFDLVIYSEEDHPQALSVAKSWGRVSPKIQIVVTQGPHGATTITQEGIHPIPTTPLPADKIVDSVGCGDVFAATMAFYYRQSSDLPKTVQQAHLAASKKLLTSR